MHLLFLPVYSQHLFQIEKKNNEKPSTCHVSIGRTKSHYWFTQSSTYFWWKSRSFPYSRFFHSLYGKKQNNQHGRKELFIPILNIYSFLHPPPNGQYGTSPRRSIASSSFLENQKVVIEFSEDLEDTVNEFKNQLSEKLGDKKSILSTTILYPPSYVNVFPVITIHVTLAYRPWTLSAISSSLPSPSLVFLWSLYLTLFGTDLSFRTFRVLLIPMSPPKWRNSSWRSSSPSCSACSFLESSAPTGCNYSTLRSCTAVWIP